MDQGWSGGIAGHYGKNYAIKIDLSKFKKQIIPDTIWIEGFYFPLFIDSGKKTGNVKMISDGKISTCIINVGYSVNGTEMHVVPDVSDYHALQNDKPAPVKFSGAALLVFHEKDNPKREFFVIPSIQHAAPINYP